MQNKTKKRIKILVAASLTLIFLLFGLGSVVYYQTSPGFFLIQNFLPGAPSLSPEAYTFQETSIPFGHRAILVKVLRPPQYNKILIAIHGVHYDGYNEARLLAFAKALAGMGIAIVVPEIDCLKNYNIIAEAIDDIEKVVLWTLHESDLMQKRKKVGLFGFSFSGGLSICAAARPSLQGKIQFILSCGGHGDLDQTMQYLTTGKLADGSYKEAHIYAVAVVLMKYLSFCVSPQEFPLMRECLLYYLRAQGDLLEKNKPRLSPACQVLIDLCIQRKSLELGQVLAPYLLQAPSDPSLSPVRGVVPSCPIFLLHGKEDSVIPPAETLRLYHWAKKSTHVEVLVSDLIGHVEFTGKLAWKKAWDLTCFLTKFIRS